MNVGSVLLFSLFVGFLYGCFTLLLGFIFYFLGFKRLAHYLLAVGGFSGKWLSSHCPYLHGHVCRIWSCSSYSSCNKKRGSRGETCLCLPFEHLVRPRRSGDRDLKASCHLNHDKK